MRIQTILNLIFNCLEFLLYDKTVKNNINLAKIKLNKVT